LALVHVVEDRARPAQRHHHALGWRHVGHDETGGDLANRDRQLDVPFRVTLELVDRIPEKARDQQGDDLQERVVAHQLAEAPARREAPPGAPPEPRTKGLALRRFRRRQVPAEPYGGQPHSASNRCSVVRSVAPSTSRVIFPSRAREIAPSSSETTMTTASV